jgi:hypothetical protein
LHSKSSLSLRDRARDGRRRRGAAIDAEPWRINQRKNAPRIPLGERDSAQ